MAERERERERERHSFFLMFYQSWNVTFEIFFLTKTSIQFSYMCVCVCVCVCVYACACMCMHACVHTVFSIMFSIVLLKLGLGNHPQNNNNKQLNSLGWDPHTCPEHFNRVYVCVCFCLFLFLKRSKNFAKAVCSTVGNFKSCCLKSHNFTLLKSLHEVHMGDVQQTLYLCLDMVELDMPDAIYIKQIFSKGYEG